MSTSPPMGREEENRDQVHPVECSGRLSDAASGGSPWIAVSERMPGLGPRAFVLATYLTSYGKPRVVRAYFAPKHTIESTGDWDEFADYSEEADCYYTPEGWYECNAHEETNWFIDEVVTHWMPLPAPPALAVPEPALAAADRVPQHSTESPQQDQGATP